MHFHGSGGQGSSACQRKWCDISDEDPDGGFIVVQVRLEEISVIHGQILWNAFQHQFRWRQLKLLTAKMSHPIEPKFAKYLVILHCLLPK